MKYWILSLLVAMGSALASGCPVEQLFPDQVAMGVARLSARNLATLVSAISNDRRCGFASDVVQRNAALDGTVGHDGAITFTVDRCTLDFGKSTTVSTDCNGVALIASGAITVSATQTIRGHLTGNPAQQVIPAGADAVDMALEVNFDGYQTRASNADNGLSIKSGRVQFRARPHLAASASLGVCAVATSDLTLDGIVYADCQAEVNQGDSRFETVIPRSNFGLQVGRWGDKENTLWGSLTVWESAIGLPTKDDRDGLDPEYHRADFERSMECTPDLELPLSYRCGSLDNQLAEGVAKLAVAAFGRVVNEFDEDTVCGFASPGVLDAQIVSGELGRDGASVRQEIVQPCARHYAAPTAIKTDCNGIVYIATGGVAATGVKRVDGINTGQRELPIAPTQVQPSLVELTMDLADFSFSLSNQPYLLRVSRGRLSGSISVQLGLHTGLHLCMIKSNAATMEHVNLSDAEIELVVEGNTFALHVDSAELAAVSGRVKGRENELFGRITIDGREYLFGTREAPAALDPDYDYPTFLASDACLPDYQHVDTDDECSPYFLAGNLAARLLVQAAGSVATMVNSDNKCGFEDTFGVLMWPTDVQGDVGEMGSITWQIESCTVGDETPAAVLEDCLGNVTYQSGSAIVDATRTVRGERESQYLIVDSVIPRDPRAVDLHLDGVTLARFTSYELRAGSTTPEQRITLESGQMSGLVQPVLGENASDRGRYDIPTPLAFISDLRLTNAAATIELDGKILKVQISSATVQAQNGVLAGVGNAIDATLVVDGHTVEIVDGDLVLDYAQSTFDQSYACTENLVGVFPSD
ncbi:MAG: hypothetical protein JXR83_11595 [Deltaproteobacteria bacterium]|nr:hypothetical protein [Deltaproteobacteria bacterium]